MPRQSKSQWDFGELFPPEQTRVGDPKATPARPPGQPVLVPPPQKVLSVSELTSQVRALLERQVGSVWVTGEVTNLRAQSSGHVYFTLKDAGAQLSCVLFRSEPRSEE